ncbi:hypothetical protein BDZ89DRAFT_1051107 [Hymenopellis radicata]|nr:hypothetical protein BDZ89DRAFT_1051107 [Hymenopellis radicata]
MSSKAADTVETAEAHTASASTAAEAPPPYPRSRIPVSFPVDCIYDPLIPIEYTGADVKFRIGVLFTEVPTQPLRPTYIPSNIDGSKVYFYPITISLKVGILTDANESSTLTSGITGGFFKKCHSQSAAISYFNSALKNDKRLLPPIAVVLLDLQLLTAVKTRASDLRGREESVESSASSVWVLAVETEADMDAQPSRASLSVASYGTARRVRGVQTFLKVREQVFGIIVESGAYVEQPIVLSPCGGDEHHHRSLVRGWVPTVWEMPKFNASPQSAASARESAEAMSSFVACDQVYTTITQILILLSQDVQDTVDGESGVLWASYLTVALAAATYQYACHQAGLVYSTQTPPPARHFKRVCLEHPKIALYPGDSPLSQGACSVSWHVVYCGIQPGVYRTYIEAAVQYVVVPGAIYNSYATYGQARNEYMCACNDKHIFEVAEYGMPRKKIYKTPEERRAARAKYDQKYYSKLYPITHWHFALLTYGLYRNRDEILAKKRSDYHIRTLTGHDNDQAVNAISPAGDVDNDSELHMAITTLKILRTSLRYERQGSLVQYGQRLYATALEDGAGCMPFLQQVKENAAPYALRTTSYNLLTSRGGELVVSSPQEGAITSCLGL